MPTLRPPAAIGRGGLLLFHAKGKGEEKWVGELKSDNPTHEGGEQQTKNKNKKTENLFLFLFVCVLQTHNSVVCPSVQPIGSDFIDNYSETRLGTFRNH